jgi:histidine phosphotransferase ChpT
VLGKGREMRGRKATIIVLDPMQVLDQIGAPESRSGNKRTDLVAGLGDDLAPLGVRPSPGLAPAIAAAFPGTRTAVVRQRTPRSFDPPSATESESIGFGIISFRLAMTRKRWDPRRHFDMLTVGLGSVVETVPSGSVVIGRRPWRNEKPGSREGDDMDANIRIAQLLCSRLCHDFAGPAGAVNAGVEFLSDGVGEASEAVDLALQAAHQMTRRLEFHRVAFGRAGRATLDDAKRLASGFLVESGIVLDWPDDPGPQESVAGTPSISQLVLNMILLGVESLPRGGTLVVRVATRSAATAVTVNAAGDGARVREDVVPALDFAASVELLSPHNIHGHFLARLARELGTTVRISAVRDGIVELSAEVPRNA